MQTRVLTGYDVNYLRDMRRHRRPIHQANRKIALILGVCIRGKDMKENGCSTKLGLLLWC